MSFKSKLLKSSFLNKAVKMAIKLTPKAIVRTAANIILKGVAEFSDIMYDLDERTAFVKLTLYGEEEAIEIALDGYEILGDEEKGYQFILHRAESNKPWMNNLLVRVIGKAWDIPPIPQYKDELGFVATLLGPQNPGSEVSASEVA